jgi:hypothetical protein
MNRNLLPLVARPMEQPPVSDLRGIEVFRKRRFQIDELDADEIPSALPMPFPRRYGAEYDGSLRG